MQLAAVVFFALAVCIMVALVPLYILHNQTELAAAVPDPKRRRAAYGRYKQLHRWGRFHVRLLLQLALFAMLLCYLSRIGVSFLWVLLLTVGIPSLLARFLSDAVIHWEERSVRRTLLKTYEEGYRLCPDCGYSLVGNTSGRCPECGYTFADESLRSDWADVEAIMSHTKTRPSPFKEGAQEPQQERTG